MAMTIAADPEADARLGDARAALAREWMVAAPSTPDEIAHFYRTSHAQAVDQAAWHANPERRSATWALCQVALQAGVQSVVDIGCGSGYDLAALREVLPSALLVGVEPNVYQRQAAAEAVAGVTMYPDIEHAPIDDADLLVCMDVLEHHPDPEAFLGAIASRAKLGAFLYEATATHDLTTPLHLRSNAGWHPGHCLDAHGWSLVSEGGGRNHVWRRDRVAAPPRLGILLCAYRAVAIPTLNALVRLAGTPPQQLGEAISPRLITKHGDGLIARSRSILISRWWAETADDVALFIDDDVTFDAEDVIRIVERCRETRSIVCGAYPVGDATHFALRCYGDTAEISFHAEADLLEVQYGATGFMAIHRAVIDAMMPTLPWVHTSEEWAFKTLFDLATVPNGPDDLIYVSEDWQFSQRARDLGFTIWLDPRVRVGHLKETEIHVRNMATIADAIKTGRH